MLALTVAGLLVAVPTAQARSASLIGATVTTQGSRWLLDGQLFVPVVDYNPPAGYYSVGPPNGCVQPDQVSTYLATGAQVVLVNQLVDPIDGRKSAGCGDTQAEQLQTMHESLIGGQLAWNFGADQTVLTRNAGQPTTNEVVNWPETHFVDIGGPGQGPPKAGVSSIVGYGYTFSTGCAFSDPSVLGPITWSLLSSLKGILANGPALAGIYLGGYHNCNTPAEIAAEFWGAIGAGAGIYYGLADYNNGNKVSPKANLVAEAGKLSGQLSDVSSAILDGKVLRLKQPKNQPVPIWINKSNGKWMVVRRKPRYPVRYVYGWRYGNQVYILVVSEGLLGAPAATHWNVHLKNGTWHTHKWHWPRVSLKLKGLKHIKVSGLFGAKGFKVENGRASIKIGAVGAKWFVFTPKK